MTRAAHLGGNAPATATPSTPLSEAVVVERYQDEQTRQWFLAVRLDGGRLVRGVWPLNRHDGSRSGERGRLPAEGTAGLVAWASFKRQGQRMYWLGSFDSYVFGMDSEQADEQVSVHPDLSADARTIDGGRTTRYPGGDTLYDGPAGTKPRVFRVRPKDFHLGGKLQDLGAVEQASGVSAVDREYVYDGARHLRRVAFTLRKKRAALRVDEDTGEIELRSDLYANDDGSGSVSRVTVQGVAGAALTLGSVVLQPEAAHASAVLDPSANSVVIEHLKSGAGNALTLKDKVSTLETDLLSVGRKSDTLDFVASSSPTKDNFDTLVNAIKALRADVQQMLIKWEMAPLLVPQLIPVKAVLRPPELPIPLKNIESRNLKSKKGGGL